jgi:hypothetical protein
MSDRGIEARDVVPAYMRVTLALISRLSGAVHRGHESCTGWAQRGLTSIAGSRRWN